MSKNLLQTVEAVMVQLANIKRMLEQGGDQVEAARLELLGISHSLPHQILGPAEWLKINLAVTKYEHLAYYIIQQFSIYKFVPLAGSISYADLSQRCGLPVDPLRRILRQAMLNHLFEEPQPGYVAHSETSTLFITNSTFASWLGHNYDEVFRSFVALPDAIRCYPGSEEPGNTACAIVFQKPQGFFRGLLQDEPWRAKRFEEAMQAVTQGEHDSLHLVRGYDWAKIANGLVVDVGGSSGFQSVAVAKAFPGLSFVVQDITDYSEKMLEIKLAAGVQSEMQFQVHDFFAPNPQRSADVYLLRHIIHDWGDDNAARILKCITDVMKPNAKIVIVDIVLPRSKTLPWHAHRMMSFLDLQMMVMLNGKERSREVWEDVVRRAHPELRITRINQPTDSVASIIELSLQA